MRWSKLKGEVESFFADSIKSRVELRATRYHKQHDQEGRGYIVVDKEELISFCTVSTWNKEYEIAEDLREISGNRDFRNPVEQEGYYKANNEAYSIAKRQGYYSQYEFYDSLKSYLSLSIDDALLSENMIIKCLVILDRRIGKRRICGLKSSYESNEALKLIFNVRCEAEGLRC